MRCRDGDTSDKDKAFLNSLVSSLEEPKNKEDPSLLGDLGIWPLSQFPDL